jgi:AraC family transcriptional regulator
MQVARIEFVIEGRRRPAPATPLFSTAHPPWNGLLLERHSVSEGRARSLLWGVPHVVLIEEGPVDIEYRALGRHHHFVAGPGSITVWPGGYETAPHSWVPAGPCQSVTAVLAGPMVRQLAEGDERLAGVALTPQRGIRDEQLAALLRAIETEARAGCPAGHLYGEALSLAVVAYVTGRYSTTREKPPPTKGALARSQLGWVLDYVQAHLDGSLSLVELAGVARLSPQHFSLAFRSATGLTPHRYVTRARVAEAERLLAAGRMSVAEVALAVGFANQSHFTQVFRVVTGKTPRRYQRAVTSVAEPGCGGK